LIKAALLVSSQANASCKSEVEGMGDLSYSTNKAASFGYWRTYVDSNPDMCWAISEPTNTDIILDKNSESTCRVRSSLSFSYFPENNAMGQIMYFGGTMLDSNKPVYLNISENTFPLSVVEGANVWAKNSLIDNDIFAEFNEAEVVRIISITDDGSVFSDTFKLNGFQNAAHLAFEFCRTLQEEL
jgi:hypothetical protein